MAAVHAISSPDVSRSHFQAQECFERGTATVATRTGWLDRALTAMGPGTTFRAIAEGDVDPALHGRHRAEAGARRHRELRPAPVPATRGTRRSPRCRRSTPGSTTRRRPSPAPPWPRSTRPTRSPPRRTSRSRPYPGGGFANRLRDVARLVKAKVGLRVATIDLGGWDMHTNLGNVNGGDMRNNLDGLAKALAAFATDLGPSLADVTLVTMTEFGRRVQENGNAGLDHGRGGLMLLLGGGLVGGQVHGKWPGLAPAALDNGDLAGAERLPRRARRGARSAASGSATSPRSSPTTRTPGSVSFADQRRVTGRRPYGTMMFVITSRLSRPVATVALLAGLLSGLTACSRTPTPTDVVTAVDLARTAVLSADPVLKQGRLGADRDARPAPVGAGRLGPVGGRRPAVPGQDRTRRRRPHPGRGGAAGHRGGRPDARRRVAGALGGLRSATSAHPLRLPVRLPGGVPGPLALAVADRADLRLPVPGRRRRPPQSRPRIRPEATSRSRSPSTAPGRRSSW